MNSLEHCDEPNSSTIVKKAFGYSLIIIGVAIGFWIISVIYDLLLNSSQIGIVVDFTYELDRTIRTSSGELELPAGLYAAIGYLIVCIFLSICARLAKTFVQFGTHLIQGDFKKLVARLTRELKGAQEASSTQQRSQANDRFSGDT